MKYSKWLLRRSDNHGDTWITETPALAYNEYLALALCRATNKKKKNVAAFALSNINDKGEYGAYNIVLGQYIQGETPFATIENKGGPDLACVAAAIKKKRVITVKALVTGGEGGSTLYYTTQVYTPSAYSS